MSDNPNNGREGDQQRNGKFSNVVTKVLFLLFFFCTLHSHWNALSSLFWLLLGNYDEDKVVVEDRVFVAMSISGQIFMIVYVVCMVIVALNMLIAMMNESYERIRVSILTRHLLFCDDF